MTEEKNRALAEGVAACLSVLEQLAEGDLTGRVDHTSEDPAMARMIAAMNRTLPRLTEMIVRVRGSVDHLVTASSGLTGVAEEMTSNVQEMTSQSAIVASATEEMSQSVETVASTTKQTTSHGTVMSEYRTAR